MANERLTAFENLYLTKLRSSLQYGLDDVLKSMETLKIRNIIFLLEKEISNYIKPLNNDNRRD